MNYLDSILDDNEKQALIAFNASDTMKQAVKKVLLAGIYANGTIEKGKEVNTTANAAFWLVSQSPTATNEELGADLRGVWQGVNALELAFQQFEKFLLPDAEKGRKENPAR